MNRFSSVRDVTASKAGQNASGMSMTFRCGACAKFSSLYGRRLKRVYGIRQYVCAACAEVRK